MALELILREGNSELTYNDLDSNFKKIKAAVDPLVAQTPATGSVTSFSSGDGGVLFTTSVATATSTPALTFSLTSQTANFIFAAPSGGNGSPTFRSLVVADLPKITIAKGGTNLSSIINTNTVLTNFGGNYVGKTLTSYDNKITVDLTDPSNFIFRLVEGNINMTNIATGVLGRAYGGTGLDLSAAANGKLLIGTGSGMALANLTAGTGITITSPTAGNITISRNASDITPISLGGTNNNTFTANGVLYYDATAGKIINNNIFNYIGDTTVGFNYSTVNISSSSVLYNNFSITNGSAAGTATAGYFLNNNLSKGLSIQTLSSAFTPASGVVYDKARDIISSNNTVSGGGGLYIWEAVDGLPITFCFGATEATAQPIALWTGLNNDPYSIGLGFESLKSSTTGYRNTAIGYRALKALTTGYENVIVGDSSSALVITTGYRNSIFGASSGVALVGGYNNTILGFGAGGSLTSAHDNVIIGTGVSPTNLVTGSYNVLIGTGANLGSDVSNTIVLSTDIGERARCLSTGAWGFGTAAPNSSFQTVGSVSYSIRNYTPPIGSGGYGTTALSNTDFYLNVTNVGADGSVTVTLPQASTCQGRTYILSNATTANHYLTLNPYSGDTLYGVGGSVSTLNVNYRTSIRVYSDGNNQWIVR